jgi:hypothetical protein
MTFSGDVRTIKKKAKYQNKFVSSVISNVPAVLNPAVQERYTKMNQVFLYKFSYDK